MRVISQEDIQTHISLARKFIVSSTETNTQKYNSLACSIQEIWVEETFFLYVDNKNQVSGADITLKVEIVLNCDT